MAEQTEIDQLRRFHALHFPGQPIPTFQAQTGLPRPDQNPRSASDYENSKELGYYEDGTKRTLTDQQIKMFRHSEIQRLLNERKALKEKERKWKRKLEREQAKAGNPDAKKRRHNDDPEPNPVDTLPYDETPEPRTASNTEMTMKKFLWPQLGGP